MSKKLSLRGFVSWILLEFPGVPQLTNLTIVNNNLNNIMLDPTGGHFLFRMHVRSIFILNVLFSFFGEGEVYY